VPRTIRSTGPRRASSLVRASDWHSPGRWHIRDPEVIPDGLRIRGRVEKPDNRETANGKEKLVPTNKNVDEGKGRLKEAAGSLANDQDLKNEGKSDRAKASVKNKVDKLAGKAKDALDRDGK